MANRVLSDADVNDIAYKLIGTVDHLEYGVTAVRPQLIEDDLTLDDLRAIDAQCFCCVTCGWWFAIEDMAEDVDQDICKECNY